MDNIRDRGPGAVVCEGIPRPFLVGAIHLPGIYGIPVLVDRTDPGRSRGLLGRILACLDADIHRPPGHVDRLVFPLVSSQEALSGRRRRPGGSTTKP